MQAILKTFKKKKLLYYNELALVNVGNIFKEYNYF